MVDFRKSSDHLITAIAFLVLGVVGTAWVIGVLIYGGRIWTGFFASPVLVVSGLVMLVNNLRPFTMRIDERGVLLEHPARKVRVALGWQHIAQVSITKLPKPKKSDRGAAVYLAVWPHDGANPGVPKDWAFQRDGRVGYRLIDVNDVHGGEEQLRTALSRYGAPVFC